MDLSLIPYVDYMHLRNLVGQAAMHRGLEYESADRVGRITWDENKMSLQGRVLGSRSSEYETLVYFREDKSGITIESTDCDCPVGWDCKHVAALVLHTNRLLEDAADGAPAVGHTPSKAAPKAKKAAPPKLAVWEQQLQILLNPPVQAPPVRWGQPTAVPAVRTPLALQFELVEDVEKDPWGAPRDTNKLPADIRLGVRPVMLGTSGKWTVGNLAWNTLYRLQYDDSINTAHREWIRVFHSLYQAAHSAPANGKWIYLDGFNSPLLWNLLDQAAGIGLEFVTSRKNSSITREDAASVGTSIQAMPDGGIRLVPLAKANDGVALEPVRLGLLGKPAHGLYWWDADKGKDKDQDKGGPLNKRAVHFARLEGAVGEQLETLVASRVPVDIPAPDRERFVENYYPKLRSTMDVRPGQGLSGLPEIHDPELVLTVTHVAAETPAKSGRSNRAGAQKTQAGAPPSLELHWHWEYVMGEETVRRPMTGEETGSRNPVFEGNLLDSLTQALVDFPEATRDPFPHAPSMHPGSNESVHLKNVAAARFSNLALPILAGMEHVRVDTSGSAPEYTELTGTPQIGISTKGTNDGDWFDLGVTVALDGTEIPFGELFLALATDEEHLMLPNGHYFALDQPEFAQLRRLIEETKSLQKPGESLTISRYQAGLWEELKELSTSVEEAAAWEKSVSGLLELQEVAAVPVPDTLHAELRPYQQEGFNWLAFLYSNGLGGVLADDMGLGKTLQTLALITHAKSTAGAKKPSGTSPGGNSRPFLVVAPTSVVSNWAAEARRFAPTLNTTAVADTLRKSGSDAASLVSGADVVITSYALFRLDNAAYASQEWAGLILDEAQFVKNHLTKASQLARAFPVKFKLAITGTPMENNLMELWSLFAVTSPGLFPSPTNFADYYRKPVEKDGNAERLKQLRRRIRPLIMRRTKDAVAKELPPKQEQVLELELAPRHRTIYQRHLQHERQKVMGLLGDMDKNRFAIFRSLTTLRMLSLDASLVDVKYASTPSSKLDVLFEQLEDVVAEGHRALIFSQFTSFLGKARERLDTAGIEYAYLDGKTTKRGAVIDKFKSGTAPVFLISLKSGGFGLNLTEADYVFLLDPWWNPATENQAVDRTHRIGQSKNVMVYRLVAKDTIEEKVMALKEKKAKLFTSVMDDDAMFSAAITADDVRGLFDV
ncbi:DEAD/DEAH box helicase [Arthrobacter sp. Sr24]